MVVEQRPRYNHAVGGRWFVDETYAKVAGSWRYVYQAVDQNGQVIDVYVSKDHKTAEINLSRALALVQDSETAYANAPDNFRRRCSQSLFKRTLIDDSDSATSELTELFHTLLSEDRRLATISDDFICLGRQQKRTDCRQQAIRIDQTEDAAAAVCAAIQLTAEQGA
jgi:hypothetical protein